MNRYIFLVFTIFFLNNNLVAQDVCIRGQAVDSGGILLENPVIVEVLSAYDSSFISGRYMEDGNIELFIDNTKPVFLKISSMGFEAVFTESIDFSLDTVDLKQVKLSNAHFTLPSVEVIGERKK